MTKLAPLAAVSPLLPLLYSDDGVNHVVSSGELRTVYVIVMAALAALGLAWRLAADSGIHQDRVEGAMTTEEDGATLLRFPAVAAPLIGLLALVGLNDLVFEPLGARGGEITLAHALPGALLALAAWFLLVRSGLVRLEAALAVLATAFASLALLAPVLPRLVPLVQPAVAALTLLLVAHPAFWARLSVRGRWVPSSLMVVGFTLLSTLLGRYGLAAREVVASSPLAVSPPMFGLLLASAAMALRAAAPERDVSGS